jgi:hypothetical protein
MCGELFVGKVPEENALSECEAVFGRLSEEELAVVCDDCFKLLQDSDPWLKEQVSRYNKPS